MTALDIAILGGVVLLTISWVSVLMWGARHKNLSHVILSLVLATVVPFFVISSLIALLEMFPEHSPFLDEAALVISVFSGVAFLIVMPTHMAIRIGACIAHVPILGGALMMYWLMFVCWAYGNCL